MKMITRDTDYALRAICFIAKNKNEIVSVDRLVEKIKIPRQFCRKILQLLNKKRILASTKGAGGGFILAKPANKIFLLDLMQIFQGPLKLSECLLKKMQCPNIKSCPLRKKLNKIEDYVVEELKSINIASLLEHK